MSTRELVEIMTGVTPPKEWRIEGREILDDAHNPRSLAIFKATGEAEFAVRAAQNFEPLVDALMDIEAAGRPHGTDRLGNACECPQCEAWDSAKAALNNALKPTHDKQT